MIPDSLLFFFNAAATTEIYTLSLHDALPISHEHHVGRLEGRVEEHELPNLTGDLGGAQVLAEPHAPRGAEHASQRTSFLRRDAQRPAPPLGNEHRLDRFPRAQAPQVLLGAVARPLARREPEAPQGEGLRV